MTYHHSPPASSNLSQGISYKFRIDASRHGEMIQWWTTYDAGRERRDQWGILNGTATGAYHPR